MKAGIIAAGRGERLRTASGPLKPLVPVGGRTLIECVLTSISETGVSEVAIIVNEDALAVRDHVMATKWPFVLRWIIETTASSMHSFLRVIETLARDGDDGPFLISTVDTIAKPQTFVHFVAQARGCEQAAITLALTAPNEDEKPLFVRCAPDNSRVIALGAAAAPSEWATAGVYAVRASVLREAEAARHDGVSALRIFLGRLLDRGYVIAGIPIAPSIDVDRSGDVRAAEEFLRSAKI